MQTVVVLLISIVSALGAVPGRNGEQRVVGGEVTTIDKHPYMAALLSRAYFGMFLQSCGGTILNERTILTAAHCFDFGNNDPDRWRVRVGSSFRHFGGFVHNVARIIRYPEYNTSSSWDYDIAVLHLASSMVFNDVVQPALIAGANYIPPDHDPVWASGWGATWEDGFSSPQLKHVELRVANQQVCEQFFSEGIITANMICVGADKPGQGTCIGDSGGPNIHHMGTNNVVVGVTSFLQGSCGEADLVPTVSTRVSRFSDWILANQFLGRQ
ncbi:trypsin domain-containing protein [Phthorimaea operculella]|nr:trypsin domain-containing protein [Phthorimaea operculella]